MFGKNDQEPSFKEAVRKIVQEELKGYPETVRRLEGEIESLKRTMERPTGTDQGKVASLEEKIRNDLSEMRKNFSKTISDQETRINEIQRLIRSLDEKSYSSKGSAAPSSKALDGVASDMKTLEKTVFEQFDQLHKTVNDLATKLSAKTRDIESMMPMLNKFQDEARALSSENFIRDLGSLKSKISAMERMLNDLKTREPVVLE